MNVYISATLVRSSRPLCSLRGDMTQSYTSYVT